MIIPRQVIVKQQYATKFWKEVSAVYWSELATVQVQIQIHPGICHQPSDNKYN